MLSVNDFFKGRWRIFFQEIYNKVNSKTGVGLTYEGVEVGHDGVERTVEFERNSIKSVTFIPFTVKIQ